MKKEYDVNINLYDNFAKRTSASFFAGDKGTMFLRIKLLSDGEPCILAESDVIELVFTNQSGGQCAAHADVTDCENGEVLYELKNCQAFAPGETEVSVTVIRGDKRLTWHGFKFNVKEAGERVIQVATTNTTIPYIGANGNWYIDDEDTGVTAGGQDGADGADGKDGKDGKDGVNGIDGITPHIGANGNWHIGDTDTGIFAGGTGGGGQSGADGKDGQAATIEIGSVITVSPEEQAEVINTGDETNAVLTFKIPCGKDGTNGQHGQNGESAYDVWLANGHEGKETDFLAWLRGGMVLSSSGRVGEVFWWTQTTAPSNSLYCDGSAISRDEYSELFDVIGTNFGEGDKETTFNLPDLRGEFIRGYDPEGVRDINGATRGLGQHQDASATSSVSHQGTSISTLSGDGVASTSTLKRLYGWSGYADTTSSFTRTKPTNVNLLPCIRCKTERAFTDEEISELRHFLATGELPIPQ